jgi:hypothetical protein
LKFLQPANEIGLGGDGFVELPSDDLPRNAGFGLSFKTVEPDGLMLLANGQKADVSLCFI